MSSPKFKALLRTLRQLFLFDRADLDFGLYRIMNARREEIEDFLENRLLPSVREHLGAVKADELQQLEKQVEETIQMTMEYGGKSREEAEESDKVIAAKRALGEASDLSALEDQVFSLLVTFFSRYYEEGDFITKRRYSGPGRERYMIPYDGEEVKLVWANMDQYYIKSGENFSNYTFKLANGKRVHFRTKTADTEKDNRKGDEKRSFFVHSEEPAEIDADGDLVLYFAYRESTKEDELNKAGEDALKERFGAKNKGDLPALRNAADALDAVSALGTAAEDFLPGLSEPAPTDNVTQRPLVAKQIHRYVAGNTYDFFIHKNLHGFLTRELDYFLKSEVLEIEDMIDAPEERVRQTLRKAKAVREIAGQLITFLANLEDFQKKLWLKKKFVTECHYCITLDRVIEHAPELLPEIVANDRQHKEWKNLYGIDRTITEKVLREDPFLMVDTGLFSDEFRLRLLEKIPDVDAQCDGVLFYSENFQALSLAESRYQEAAKVVYIDPPYNTNASAIPYKNNYKHSSWGILMQNRIDRLNALMSDDSAIFVSIDKNERLSLDFALRNSLGEENFVEELIWSQNTNDGRSPTYSTNHEYVLVYAKDKLSVENDYDMFREPKPGYSDVMQLLAKFEKKVPPTKEVEAAIAELYSEHKKKYKEEVLAQDLDWEVEKRNDPWKGLYAYQRAEYRLSTGEYVPEAEARKKKAELWIYTESDWTIMSSESKQSDTTRDPNHLNFRYYTVLHPVTGRSCNPSSRGWKGTRFIDPEHPDRNSFESLQNDNRISFGEDETKVPRQKRFLHEVESNVCKSVFTDYSDGEKETYAMFGKAGVFLAPKHSRFVERFIQQGSKKDSLIIDCFGGSGSTAHAVINQNREDKGNRKYLLAEMGFHFDRVLKPRIKKAVYSADWRAGKPLDRATGISHCFKYLRLESYEDALNNLEAKRSPAQQEALDRSESLKDEYLLGYFLDPETQDSASLLKLSAFKDPWAYKLMISTTSVGEMREQNIDLVETFNYLIGLQLEQITSLQTVRPDRNPERDDNGQLRVKNFRKADYGDEGSWTFQVVSGKTRAGEKTLILWRTLSGDLEMDNAVLEAFLNKQDESPTRQDWDVLYVNGDSNLQNLEISAEDSEAEGGGTDARVFKVRMIEQEFKKRMFAETE